MGMAAALFSGAVSYKRPIRRMKMKIPRKIFGELADCILEGGAYKAVKYFDETTTVKATRRLFKYNKRKIDKRRKCVEILFTIGIPNYEEREFIKKVKKAGEPFPVKKIKLKFPKQ